MNNPSHKQKKSQDPDAPQWYIDAWIDAMNFGMGVVLFRADQPPVHITREQYTEFTQALEHSIKTTPPQ